MQQSSKPDPYINAVHGEYYPHIDGIRALAVIPVLLFHIMAVLCPGGFAGVDVFFVISGYLITGGILRDLEKNRFTVRNFYYRRVRRIMPAYFAMIAGVFAAGCVLYYAAPLMLLGDAVTAGTLFVANIHFWTMGDDYFSSKLHSQALLHLWSLSVEEQFYLFIPLFCAVLWKVRRRLVAPALILLAGVSLFGAIYAVMTGKQNSAFYLLHFRAWELLTGSLLAMIPAAAPHNDSHEALRAKKKNGFFAIAGFLMVVATYIFISAKTPFPGAVAIFPVIGTAILIRYGQNGLIGRFLCWRPSVAIGKISYSLYLWHWPVVVFWRYAAYDQIYAYDYLGMFLLSLALGYLSWKFVELPVRISSVWTMRRAFAFSATGIVCLVIAGTACVYSKGWPALHPKADKVAYMTDPRDPFVVDKTFKIIRKLERAAGHNFTAAEQHEQDLKVQHDLFVGQEGNRSSTIGAPGEPELFILGDSHAGNLQYGMDVVLRKAGISAYNTSLGGSGLFNLQLPATQLALKTLESFPKVKTVILAQMWSSYNSDIEYARLEEFARHINSMGKTLVILTDTPCYQYQPNDIAARTEIITPRHKDIAADHYKQPEGEYDRMQGGINRRLEEVCKKTGAVLIPSHMAFFEKNSYLAFDARGGRLIPFYSDSSHLSHEGSLRLSTFVVSALFPDSVIKM